MSHYDLNFLTFPQINSFIDKCFDFINGGVYLEQILLCFSSFSFQNYEVVKTILDIKYPFFEFFFDSLFSQKFDFALIINSISCFIQKNILIQKRILSILFSKGSIHSILLSMIKTGIDENKVISFSNFLSSVTKFPICSIEILDDLFESIDTVIQSQFESAHLQIAKAVKNIVYHLIFYEDECCISDNNIECIIETLNNYFIIENLFEKMDENEELIKYVCCTAGLLRYKCNINDKIDLVKITNLINSNNDEIVACSSRCFADFCYIDPSFSLQFFNLDYFINLLKKFENFSMENKMNTSFQIVVFANFLPLNQLFDLCKNDPENEICLLSIFAQITNTMSVFLLEFLLKLVINIFDYSASIQREEEIDKDEFIMALKDLQLSDIFDELEKTEIPKMIDMLLKNST